jgi:hypothetical protein
VSDNPVLLNVYRISQQDQTTRSRSVYAALFVIALATLALEITLSRILSVVTWYHLSFFAISVAMLGMTAGAITVFLWDDRLDLAAVVGRVRRACGGFAISAPLSIVAASYLPLHDAGVTFDVVKAFTNLLIITSAMSLPFYASGIAVSALLTKYPLPVNRLYASDLLGASAGCLVVLIGLTLIDTPSFGLLSGFVGWLAAIFLLRGGHKRLWTAALAVTATAVVSASVYSGAIEPRAVKGDARLGPIAIERWNSFSRVVVSEEQVDKPYLWDAYEPFYADQRLPQHYMTIDGLAGTVMRRYQSLQDIEHLKYDVTNIAYFLRPTGGAAVIGVGGGKDIQAALYFGHESVTGVELNPIFVDLLQHRYREFAGIGSNGKVSLVVDEARSYMSHSTRKFSLLQMSLIDTWASTGAGAFSLSENALYTLEAWRVFMDRLEDDGIFTVSRWYNKQDPGETGRMLSLAMATLMDRGVTNPADHIAVVAHERVATLILGKSALTADDIARLFRYSAELKHDVTIYPGGRPAHPLLAQIMSAKTRQDLIDISDRAPLNVTPATDQNPYFFNMLKLSNLGALGSQVRGGGVLAGNLLATYTLIVLIVILVVLIVPTILVPLWIRTRRDGGHLGVGVSSFGFFALIGAGFMCVEIGLLQRLSVCLGHPVYALGVLLFSVIASTGVGSFVSEKFRLDTSGKLATLSLVCVASIALSYLALDAVFDTVMTMATPIKVVVSVLIILPTGLVMGFFFPTGMTICRQRSEAATAWLWATNGIFSVLFSAVCVFVSIYGGIAYNFYIAMLFYALTAVCGASMVQEPAGLRTRTGARPGLSEGAAPRWSAGTRDL